jgi:hypothetical protein
MTEQQILEAAKLIRIRKELEENTPRSSDMFPNIETDSEVWDDILDKFSDVFEESISRMLLDWTHQCQNEINDLLNK